MGKTWGWIGTVATSAFVTIADILTLLNLPRISGIQKFAAGTRHFTAYSFCCIYPKKMWEITTRYREKTMRPVLPETRCSRCSVFRRIHNLFTCAGCRRTDVPPANLGNRVLRVSLFPQQTRKQRWCRLHSTAAPPWNSKNCAQHGRKLGIFHHNNDVAIGKVHEPQKFYV